MQIRKSVFGIETHIIYVVKCVRGEVLRILIAQHNVELGKLWAGFLEREGIKVTLADSQSEALKQLRAQEFDALVLEMVLPDGGAIAIADFASYRLPDVPVITVNSSGFFSDGSIFQLLPNVHSVLQAPVKASDLAAVVSHIKNKPRASGPG